MKQITSYMSDELHKILAKEAAKRQLETGDVIKVSNLLIELVTPVLESLDTQNAHQDAPPIENPETSSKIVSGANYTAKSQLVQDFDKLDF